MSFTDFGDIETFETLSQADTTDSAMPTPRSMASTSSESDSGTDSPLRQRPISSGSEDADVSNDVHRKCLNEKDNFRASLLRKLSLEKGAPATVPRVPRHQTVIIFDWDNTLLCTSYLHAMGSSLSPNDEQCVRRIEKATKRLLELALQVGHALIITNAKKGWVEYSAATYAPELLPVLERMHIISARSQYGACNPGDVGMWKVHAFRDLRRQLDLPIITNLISMGDSHYEMDATEIVGKEFSEVLVKTIKMRENPTPEVLLKQLNLIAAKFETIVNTGKNLQIGVEQRKPVGVPA